MQKQVPRDGHLVCTEINTGEGERTVRVTVWQSAGEQMQVGVWGNGSNISMLSGCSWVCSGVVLGRCMWTGPEGHLIQVRVFP